MGIGTVVQGGAVLTDAAMRGTPNDSGSDIVLDYIRPAAITPGLAWLGALLTDGDAGGRHHLPGFPPDGAGLAFAPVAGHLVAAGADVDIAFGERVDGGERNGLQGLLIGYRIGDQRFETRLDYRSVLCTAPVTSICDPDLPVPGLPDPPRA